MNFSTVIGFNRKELRKIIKNIFLVALIISSFIYSLSLKYISINAYVRKIDFETPEHFETGLDAPIWNNSGGPWYLYKNHPVKDNPIYPEIPNLFEQSIEQVHSGTYSAKLTLLAPSTDRARRIHIEHDWDPINDRHIWFECWYYLPHDFIIDYWTNLHRACTERLWIGDKYEWFQLGCSLSWFSKVSDTEYRLHIDVPAQGFVDNNDDGYNDLLPKQSIKTPDAVRFGAWFKITTYVYRDMNEGIYIIWLNDVLQYEFKNIRTIGILPERIAEVGDYGDRDRGYVTTGFGLYTGTLPNVHPKYAYFDDIVIKASDIVINITTTTIITTTTETDYATTTTTTTTTETTTSSLPRIPGFPSLSILIGVLIGIIIIFSMASHPRSARSAKINKVNR